MSRPHIRSAEQRAAIVAQVIERGQKPGAVALEHGISHATVVCWLREHQCRPTGRGPGVRWVANLPTTTTEYESCA